MRMCPFRTQIGSKIAITSNKNFSRKTINIILIYPFHCAKKKKNVTTDPELWENIILLAKIAHSHQTIISLKNH